MKTSAQFYKELGVKKLAGKTTQERTKKELSYIKRYLKKSWVILDLACGYGRFTIPLAKEGYKIQGLDISQNLLANARKAARKEGLNIKLRLGDMRSLPYKDNSFDAVICMWSAFNELASKKDQIMTLKEILRVLRNGGFAFLDVHYSKKIQKRVATSLIEGVKSMPTYQHDKNTLRKLMNAVRPAKYKVFIGNFGGREKLLVLLWK